MAPHIGKVSPWLYLLLAHLVADFILQPYVLVRLKRQPVGLEKEKAPPAGCPAGWSQGPPR